MWNMITHFLTFAGGMLAGVVLMCLLQAGRLADEDYQNEVDSFFVNRKKCRCFPVAGTVVF